MSDTSLSPPPAAVETWSRVARRIRVPMSFALAIAYVWLAHPTRTTLLAGGLLLIPGLLLRGLASGHVQKDRQLTMSGPYAYTRNPLYLGSLTLAAGFALAARSPAILILLVLMFVIIYVPVIAGEERYLRQTFSEYEDYSRHVPRLWLRFTRYGNQAGAFSSALYLRHKEYNAIIGCLVVLAILIVKLFWPFR
jgi:protein-S-isoprenylcysteine O-methyltransferase Ste14